MDSPDELYTLRAQFWLGHYNLSIDEAKSIIRRPMTPQLKIEREEFYLRSLLEMKRYDDVIREASSSSNGEKSPGVQAISLRAQYDSPSTPPSQKQSILLALQQLISNPNVTPTAQLIAAQTFLSHGSMTKEAFSCVHLGQTMEQKALLIQIYIRMDRIDLANQTLKIMKQTDEESILTQLSSVYIHLAIGRSETQDAIHTLGSLTEQYGNSTMLLNLNAVSNIVMGKYDVAEKFLVEALAEEVNTSSDTLINLIVCYQHLGKGMSVIGPLLEQLKNTFPNHPFVQGLERVDGAFERESVKYQVAA